MVIVVLGKYLVFGHVDPSGYSRLLPEAPKVRGFWSLGFRLWRQRLGDWPSESKSLTVHQNAILFTVAGIRNLICLVSGPSGLGRQLSFSPVSVLQFGLLARILLRVSILRNRLLSHVLPWITTRRWGPA